MAINLKTLLLFVTLISGFFFGLLDSHVGNQISYEEKIIINDNEKEVLNVSNNKTNNSISFDTCSINSDFSC